MAEPYDSTGAASKPGLPPSAPPALFRALAIFVCLRKTGYGPRDHTARKMRARTKTPALALGCLWAAWSSLACSPEREAEAHSAPDESAQPQEVDRSSPPASEASPQAPTPAEPADSKPAAEEPAKPRVYAKSRFVWIREYPSSEVQWIGYLWTGGSVALKSDQIYYGPGCEHWYAVEPAGYVCVDGKRATLDPNDEVYKALVPYAGDLSSAWPHHYGESRGLPRFTTVPPAEHLPAPLGSNGSNGVPSHGAIRQLSANPFESLSLPGPVHEGRTRLLPRSTVAYSAELARPEHPLLLAADMTWVPKDRVTPYPKVTFKGVELGGDVSLPLAFFRGKDRPEYALSPSGELSETGGVFKRLSYVELTGESIRVGDDVYLQVKSRPVYVKQSDAVLPQPREKTPWGTRVGSNDTTGHPKGRATWMEASVWGGWLIAYEGTKPVYVTMISPGRGGTPVPGKDPLETASTPTGNFPISGKFATATMEAPGEYIHSDVPWTQNFSGPHALHGAYWHDDWGKLKSAGCVNVSPLDGRWLFEFTEPAVPDGWHGVRWLPSKGPATLFVIHR